MVRAAGVARSVERTALALRTVRGAADTTEWRWEACSTLRPLTLPAPQWGSRLVGLVMFGTVATTRSHATFSDGSPLVLCLIVAGWLFAATLVWGTGYATKVRWSAAWTYQGDAWEWTALLAVALIGGSSL